MDGVAVFMQLHTEARQREIGLVLRVKHLTQALEAPGTELWSLAKRLRQLDFEFYAEFNESLRAAGVQPDDEPEWMYYAPIRPLIIVC